MMNRVIKRFENDLYATVRTKELLHKEVHMISKYLQDTIRLGLQNTQHP